MGPLVLYASIFHCDSAACRASDCGRAAGDVGQVRCDGVLLRGVHPLLRGLPHCHQEHGHGLLLHGCSARNHHLPIYHLSGSVTCRLVRKPRLYLLLLLQPPAQHLLCARSSHRSIRQGAAVYTDGQFGYFWFRHVSPSA